MINLDNITNENNNEKWLYIPNDQHKILIIVGSGSGKTNALNKVRLTKFICMQKI